LDEKGSEFSKKAFFRKIIGGNLDSRTGIGAEKFSVGRHDVAGRWGDFEYLESNMTDKHANNDSGILSSNMHNEDI